jgi:hypothetical protein
MATLQSLRCYPFGEGLLAMLVGFSEKASLGLKPVLLDAAFESQGWDTSNFELQLLPKIAESEA